MTSEAKRAAAVAAVCSYLSQAQAGAAGALAGAAGDTGLRAGQAAHPGPWALYGRRALMDQRIRMQARRRA
jgi:hypothetical protein